MEAHITDLPIYDRFSPLLPKESSVINRTLSLPSILDLEMDGFLIPLDRGRTRVLQE